MPDAPDPADVIRARIAVLEQERARIEAEIGKLVKALDVLTSGERHANEDSMSAKPVSQAARVSFSKGQGKKSGKTMDKLIAYASDAGYTLRGLADAVKISGPLITMARKGDRGMRMEYAKRICELTRSAKHPEGFAATSENWPDLRD